jgi:hypothetical protein
LNRVFSALIGVSGNWPRVVMTRRKIKELDRLREELGKLGIENNILTAQYRKDAS